MGSALRWANGGQYSIPSADAGASSTDRFQDDSLVGDVNVFWRQTFTLRPAQFVDLWTPCVFGLYQTKLSHPEIDSWIVSLLNVWFLPSLLAVQTAASTEFQYFMNSFLSFIPCRHKILKSKYLALHSPAPWTLTKRNDLRWVREDNSLVFLHGPLCSVRLPQS